MPKWFELQLGPLLIRHRPPTTRREKISTIAARQSLQFHVQR
jgi:hypothetical protein